ncbi:MAG: SMC-Scp complex subunit ScpB [Candidatus Aenigmatarchaeota archaeon]
MATNLEKLAILEAILFTTDRPLTISQLSKRLRVQESTVEKLIVELREKYKDEHHGIRLYEIGGYKLTVKDKFMEHVSDLTPHADLKRGLLRVLSIIAFHEPVKQSDIVKVIGNRTYEYIKELKDRGLIIVRKQGRTNIIETSPQFEEYFGIRKSDLKKALSNKLEDNAIHEDNVGNKQDSNVSDADAGPEKRDEQS